MGWHRCTTFERIGPTFERKKSYGINVLWHCVLLFNLTLNGTVNIFPEANVHNVEDGSFKNNIFT